MKVITLEQSDFESTSAQLGRLASPANPDLIIGIRRGGAYVAQVIRPQFPDASYIEIESARNGTYYKNNLHNILKSLPIWFLDFARIMEAKILSLKKRREREFHISTESIRVIKDSRRILIVDDAVDSGATLSAVVNAVKDINKASQLMTAAIVVTTKKPIIYPDFVLYKRDTLIRFPWSNDYKQ